MEEKNKYSVDYIGRKPAYFDIYETIEEAKQAATNHAAENPRIKGRYSIVKADIICGFVTHIYDGGKLPRGEKHGKTIEWNF